MTPGKFYLLKGRRVRLLKVLDGVADADSPALVELPFGSRKYVNPQHLQPIPGIMERFKLWLKK